jgi:hypothetical protein
MHDSSTFCYNISWRSLKSCGEAMENGRIPTPIVASYFSEILYLWYSWGRRGRDRVVVGSIATCTISAYHHKICLTRS